MDYKEKTEKILALLERRNALPPVVGTVDSRLEQLDRLPWTSCFSAFNEKHIKEASKLFKILRAALNFDDFMQLCEGVRTIENDDLFLYALYTAVLHRSDCKGVSMPPIEECAPHWFFAAETIHEAIQLSIQRPDEDHVVINQKTAQSSDPESVLAYFREDIGLNTHHWSWHIVFPSDWDENETGIVKDRKGELFYYMHQQMMARYDCERLSNGMNRVSPLSNFQEELEGYSPHLTSQTTGVHFGSRPDGLVLKDLPNLTVNDLDLWRWRIYDAIDRKFVQDASGIQISLDNEKGIDILGAIVEASSSSVNRTLYGDLHNSGHQLISQVHDPGRKRREFPGVMGFIETAARDPIFYRWHKFLDDIFYRHKSTLRPYTRNELLLQGIKVASAEVVASQRNVLKTFIVEDHADLSHAPFLKTKRKIWVKYERLEHENFSYAISIDNNTEAAKPVTVRIFLGPKYDEFGNPFELNDQRRLMIEMDKFYRNLTPGSNHITRHAIESSVTLPRRRYSFATLRSRNYEPTVDYCSCGWPDPLLIPRGTVKGLDFVLYVMCTDYDYDNPGPVTNISTCNEAISYCGSKGEKYPDTKPMGYPFDRVIEQRNFQEFLTENMILTNVKIQFLERAP